jgi:pectinesterase
MTKSCTVAFLLCAMVVACRASGPALSLRLKNPTSVNRRAETIGIPLATVNKVLPNVDVNMLCVRERKSGKEMLSQIDGGTLLFQTDIPANAQKEFVIRGDRDPRDSVALRVDGAFFPPREDYAWENDRIAFRVYGPALAKDVNNGIDVWCKRVRSLIVRKWYKASESSPPGHDAYHEDHGEGADFFEVGRSLGAGGSGLWENGKILQPGVFTSWRTLACGPLRVRFELTYKSWVIGGDTVSERRTFTLDAGSNLNRIDVVFEGPKVPPALRVACGLVKRSNVNFSYDSTGGWMSLWGPTNSDAANGSLGTAVVIPGTPALEFAEDGSQHLIIVPLKTGNPFTYYAGAGWTRSGDFETEKAWLGYLKDFAFLLRHPLVESYVTLDE